MAKTVPAAGSANRFGFKGGKTLESLKPNMDPPKPVDVSYEPRKAQETHAEPRSVAPVLLTPTTRRNEEPPPPAVFCDLVPMDDDGLLNLDNVQDLFSKPTAEGPLETVEVPSSELDSQSSPWEPDSRVAELRRRLAQVQAERDAGFSKIEALFIFCEQRCQGSRPAGDGQKSDSLAEQILRILSTDS